jgi:hypothetical protein
VFYLVGIALFGAQSGIFFTEGDPDREALQTLEAQLPGFDREVTQLSAALARVGLASC